MSHPLPNFIIAGEGKAGTSALYKYLSQHPDVFMCEPKEPRYFAFRNTRPDFSGPMDEELFNRTTIYKRDEYYGLFKSAINNKAVGEASPVYIHIPGCAAAISEELPQVKLIVLLRHPAELAFSAYQHQVRNGNEQLSFEDALAAEPERARLNWGWGWRYSRIGFVADNIEDYLQHFSRDQILFINYDDYKMDNFATLRQICQFLCIPEDYQFKASRANVNARPRIRWLHRIMMNPDNKTRRILRALLPASARDIIRGILKTNMRPVHETINPDTYIRLASMYSKDILKCQDLTGLDLRNWLENT